MNIEWCGGCGRRHEINLISIRSINILFVGERVEVVEQKWDNNTAQYRVNTNSVVCGVGLNPHPT